VASWSLGEELINNPVAPGPGWGVKNLLKKALGLLIMEADTVSIKVT
jgi:hypothetical protein